MRGSTYNQVQAVYSQSGVNQIGKSKHAAKEAAREGGAGTWSEMGRQMGIHSYGTADSYREVWRSVLDHARQEHGVKDIERISPEIIKSYLQERIEQGVARSTYDKEAAAIGKLEVALNRYSEAHERGISYEFRTAIDATRDAAKGLEKFEGSRAYDRPAELVAAVSNRDHQITAAVQLESGSRIHEASLIKTEQLQGYKSDPVTGEQRGVIAYQGKGGKEGEHLVSPATYQAVEQIIQERGVFQIDKDSYRDSLAAAAATTGQEYTDKGSHGLRWNYAQERCSALQEHHGLTYDQAMLQVSSEMGHERADITEHYLR